MPIGWWFKVFGIYIKRRVDVNNNMTDEVREYLEEKEWGYPYGRYYQTPRVNQIDIDGYALDDDDDDEDDDLNY